MMTSRFKFVRQPSVRISSYSVFHRISGLCIGELWKERDGSWSGVTMQGQMHPPMQGQTIHYPGSRETAAGILYIKYTGA